MRSTARAVPAKLILTPFFRFTAMPKRKMLLLTDGCLDVFAAKTAVTLLRYCPDEVVAVLDAEHAGWNLADLVGVGAGVPIVPSVAAARPLQPDHLVIGAVFPGGELPATWRAVLLEALASGMHVVNGLHTPVSQDAELAARAAEYDRCIYDLRLVTREYPVGAARALTTRATRILTVGSDCNLGKMATAMELVAEVRVRGRKAEFVATGQTGVMVAGRGEVLDAVKSDFVSGAVEALVLEADETGAEFIVVEGQGGLLHPAFSAVTLGLMHGVLPDVMILCHDPQRTHMRHTRVPVPALHRLIALHEAILDPIHPAKVVGVSLICLGMTDQQMQSALAKASEQTGLPAVDSIRTGVAPLVDRILESAP